MSSSAVGSVFSGVLVSCGVAALGAALGCASVLPPLTPPEAGGPAWRELASKHVVLRTDREEGEAREALVDLERAYVALREVGFPNVNIDGRRIAVVHFDRERDYLKFESATSVGVFRAHLPNDLAPEPTMVLYGTLGIQVRGTFQHELTHMFVRASLAGVPTWLNEGLAQYYQTLAVEDGAAFVGRPLVAKRAWAQTEWGSERVGPVIQVQVPIGAVPSVEKLTGLSPGEFYVSSADPNNPSMDDMARITTSYLGAWGLVHLLLHDPEYQPRFDSMMEQIGKGAAPRKAWEVAIEGVDAEEMETAYRQHLLNKYETMVLRTPYQHPEVPIEAARVLDPAEVHVLWARLRDWQGPSAAAARADMEAAVALGKGSPEVSFWSGLFQARMGNVAAAEEALRAAVAARPDDTRYLHGLAALLRDLAAQKGASPDVRRKADEVMARFAKVASTGMELRTLAFDAVSRGRADEALVFAQRSVKADPVCPQCFSMLGTALFAKKDFGAALAAQQLSISLLPDGARVAREEAKLRLFEEAVRKQAAGETAPVEKPAAGAVPGAE